MSGSNSAAMRSECFPKALKETAMSSIVLAALLAAATRRNGKRLLTMHEAQAQLARNAPVTAVPRAVHVDCAISFNGQRFPVPNSWPGEIVLVSLLPDGRAAIQFHDAAPRSTSASPARSRNPAGTGRAASRPSHSGSSTSVGKTLPTGNSPFRHTPYSASVPARSLRRTSGSGSAGNPVVVAALDDHQWPPRNGGGSEYSGT